MKKESKKNGSRNVTVDTIAASALIASSLITGGVIISNTVEAQNSEVFDSAKFAQTSISSADLSFLNDEYGYSNIDNKIQESNEEIINDRAKEIIITTTVAEETTTTTTVPTTTAASKEDKSKIIEQTIEIEFGSKADETLKCIDEDTKKSVEKYCEDYQVDPAMIYIIIMQESGGKHDPTINNNGVGIMQIERCAHKNSTKYCYNYRTGKHDKHFVNDNALKDKDTNIKLGIMIFRSCLDGFRYNPLVAFYAYNHGSGITEEKVRLYAKEKGRSYEEVLDDWNDIGWIKYFENYKNGDYYYLEHVLRYLTEDKLTFRIGGGRYIVYHFKKPTKEKTHS